MWQLLRPQAASSPGVPHACALPLGPLWHLVQPLMLTHPLALPLPPPPLACSIEFVSTLVDYVSCSPLRVPIARLAAAQAAIKAGMKDGGFSKSQVRGLRCLRGLGRCCAWNDWIIVHQQSGC